MNLQQPAYCKDQKKKTTPNKSTLLVGCCVRRNFVSVLKSQFKHCLKRFQQQPIPISQRKLSLQLHETLLNLGTI